MNSETVVDLAFPITPGLVPIDHGYLLYAAIASAVPELHEAGWLAIHPLNGVRVAASELTLTRESRVTLRLPAEHIAKTLPLSGKEVRLGAVRFRLGSPSISTLEPSPNLFARHVAIRLTSPPQTVDGALDVARFEQTFAAEARRQLVAQSIESGAKLLARRTIAIKGQRILGFAVRIEGLTAEQSIRLQVQGLGGKRRMGCGIFQPVRRGDA